MTPRPSGCRAQQVGDLELRLAEELVAAAVLELDERTEKDADRLLRDAADAGQLLLALLRLEKRQQRAEVGEVDEREPALVRVAEHERQLDSCVSFAPRTLASSCGPKSVTEARTGTPGPMPPSESSSTGSSTARAPSRGPPCAPRPSPRPGRGRAGPTRRPCSRRRTPRPRIRRLLGEELEGQSCLCRSRRRSGRAGSTWRAGAGRPRRRRARRRGRPARARATRPGGVRLLDRL